jgi:iron-sulfur cluster repair protein YtfE (RIC family)
MNALELLKTDHQKVSELFEQLSDADNLQEKQKLFEQIRTELETHTHIEETAFYPVLEEYEELKDQVAEAYEEHQEVKTLLGDISGLTADAENFDDKVSELQENVEHHVDEEENEMFPQIEQLIAQTELQRIGSELELAKKEFKKSSSATTSRR